MESTHRKLPLNPCENANCLSKIFMAWTVTYYKKCYGKMLKVDDIFQPLTCDKSQNLGDQLEQNWFKHNAKEKRHSLLYVIFATFWRRYAFLSVICFTNDVMIRICHPFLLGYLLQYFQSNTDITNNQAMSCAIGIVILNALNALLNNHTLLLSNHIGMKVRIALSSLIYRKTLRLSQTAFGSMSTGNIVNLLTNDVNRFDWATFFLNALWISPLITLLIGCILWNEVKFAGLIGILVIFLTVPLLSFAGRLTVKYRLQTAQRTDDRVRFMDEIISSVQVIKLYAWETAFAKIIDSARRLELKVLRKTSYIRGFFMTFNLFTTRLALFFTMVAITLLYGSEKITAANIFVISGYFNIISHIMSLRFSRGIAECSEAYVSLQRIEKLLYLEEKRTDLNFSFENKNGIERDPFSIQRGPNLVESKTVTSSTIAIAMKNVTACWTNHEKNSPIKNSIQNGNVIQNGDTKHCHETISDLYRLEDEIAKTLDCLSIEFPKGKLIGVIGPVGAGKSSLLQAILRELPLKSGSIDINGSISYANQESWVFSASVRQNILFGEEYDRNRYNAVVRTCALEKDFEQFENGDRTIVGERGASLSGGQKARINLARACYRNADIYLLDDPLSAVDAHVGTHIFDKCIGPKSHLARKKATRILVSHQVHFLKEADWLIILKNGKIEIQGSPHDLVKSGVDFAKLIGTFEVADEQDNCEIFKREFSQTFSIRSASTESLNSSMFQDADNEENGVSVESSSKGKVNGSLYVNYFKAGVNWCTLVFVCATFIFAQLLVSAADYWVSVWIKQEESRTYRLKPNLTLARDIKNITSTSSYVHPSFKLTTEQCVYIQGTLVAAIFIVGISRSSGFFAMCMRSSQNIHNAMFNGLISTSMRFFDTNPSGRILNRNSKDIGIVDEMLPKSMLDTAQCMLSVFGSITLTILVNPFFLVPIPILILMFYFLQRVYLKTSKNLIRLEAISKSPSFTHLSATINGLKTVRAYKMEKILLNEFDSLQDIHSACWYMVISTNTMFGFSLDIICLLFTSTIIFYYMLYDTRTSADKIGLAITQALSLTGICQFGVRQSADVSNQMMAVERVLEYRDLEPEKQPKSPTIISSDWPSSGCIEFKNVFYRYFTEAEPVLRGLSFVIKPMEKIGIVGRTGAGKSSLIGAIFRLACVEGEIRIDGIDTANIQLSDLRKRIAIIPQDPVLFSGTLRRNLDPFEEYSDEDIWSALESVELKSIVSDALGLQSQVLPHGANYSVGQRQLLCLARAILRKNRILVMDEATANVDPQTDLLIQQTIRQKFNECTVLTVAHRLHTIIDSDRVIVMDSGRAAEFDDPHSLLQNENGIFYGMVKALGSDEFYRLSQFLNKYEFAK